MLFLFLILGLIGYFSAWVVNPGVALTLHAFDLAEWGSLHPLVRAEPMLITTLLLRLPLLCFGILFAFSAIRTRGSARLLDVFMAGAIALGLLPPLDFLTQFNNTNYQQQAVLALICVAAIALSMFKVGQRVRLPLSLLTAAVGGISGIVGFARADDLMRMLGMPARIGVGAWITPILFFGVIAALLWQQWQSRRIQEQGSPSVRTAPP